jgi:hypothetical protein
MSTVVSKNVQIGADGTASNNFTAYQPSTPDGTLRIGNGNSGSVTDAIVLNSSGVVSFTNNPTLSGGTANGVAYLNGSKVLTSGSALTTNGSSLGVGSSDFGGAGSINVSVGVAGTTTGGLQLWSTTTGQHYVQFGDGTAGAATYAGAIGYSHATDQMFFYANGSEQMRLTSTGLGIGTSSPGARLQVTSAVSGSYGAIIYNTHATGQGLTVRGGSTSSQDAFNVQTYDGGTSLLTVQAGGNVGIGTSSPQRKLSIANGGPVVEIDPAGGTAGPIYFNYNRSTATYLTPEYWALAHIWNVSGGTKAMTLDSSGNLGLGVTPSAWASAYKVLQIGSASSIFNTSSSTLLVTNGYIDSGFAWRYQNTSHASRYTLESGSHIWYTAPSGTAGNAISFTQAMTLDASGNLLVGATSVAAKLTVEQTGGNANGAQITNQTSGYQTLGLHNTATSGDNLLVTFVTDASSFRGSILFNRAGGLVAYNTTSDYRAKDISGPLTDSGAVIDSTPVYMGKMKGATQERPMFIAHETPAYAHTGEKDAIDKDGNPVYQQMDASALVPVMWAEIQSLRKRLAAAGIA